MRYCEGQYSQLLYRCMGITIISRLNKNRHAAMNSIIEGLSRLVTEARLYIEHLQMQLNMLTLGHLSPRVISPKN